MNLFGTGSESSRITSLIPLHNSFMFIVVKEGKIELYSYTDVRILQLVLTLNENVNRFGAEVYIQNNDLLYFSLTGKDLWRYNLKDFTYEKLASWEDQYTLQFQKTYDGNLILVTTSSLETHLTERKNRYMLLMKITFCTKFILLAIITLEKKLK